MPNKSIVWVPRSDEKTTSNYGILEFHLAAHKPQYEDISVSNTKMTNHWQIFLRWSSTNSIGLDPSPNYPKMDMTLSCISKNYVCTENAHKVVVLTPKKPITVGRLLELLTKNKCDKYVFTPSGNGCRYWVNAVVELLGKEDVVDDADVIEAFAAIDTVWCDGKPVDTAQQTRLNDCQGTFAS